MRRILVIVLAFMLLASAGAFAKVANPTEQTARTSSTDILRDMIFPSD